MLVFGDDQCVLLFFMIFGVLVFNLKEFPHHSEGTYQHRSDVQTSTGNHCRNHVPTSELTKVGDFSVGFLILNTFKELSGYITNPAGVYY